MNFKDLNIKSCYESGIDDIIEDYYIPVLGASVQYDRIAGFFSSSSLAVAARGLANFIAQKGKMRLITSPRLNSDDAEIIKRITNDDNSLKIEDFGIDFSSIESEFEKNHVKALGWMLSNGLLDMKLAVVYNSDGSICDNDSLTEKGLFHQKVGILCDSCGNKISFSGSINESASAWVDNDEEFKVFKEWTDAKDYFLRDKERFEEIWNGKRKNVRVYSLPKAIKDDIIEYSSDFKLESISLKKYHSFCLKKYDFKKDKTLFFYQADALNKWKQNGYQMLFEMATGTGKTRTAIAGIKYLNKINQCLITIISTPQNTLSKQWKDEIESQKLDFDESCLIDGSVAKWDAVLNKLLLRVQIGLSKHICIYTTHNTASSTKFISLMTESKPTNCDILFVGDETHWLGAKVFQKALLQSYKYRIGLSATPSRWYDEIGTTKLIDFYGNCNFEFTIHDALTQYNPLTGKHFLVNYDYNISKVSLDESESILYKEVSTKISRLWNLRDNDADAAASLERLLEKRANIIKNASAKYEQLKIILDEIGKEDRVDNLIIFVSPQQLQEVIGILAERNIIYHKLTEKEGTKPEKKFGNKSEREDIISKFKAGIYQVIIAIKCMDEGIDIPCADIGILMASSTNPREYIQRVGRIIRQSPNKRRAKLYDICVDTVSNAADEYKQLEKKIKQKEQIRLKEIAANAINSIEALQIINSLD